MTKTSALKVGSKLDWYYTGDKSDGSYTMTVTHITKGKVYVEWRNEDGVLRVSDWSRRELNRTRNIRVLSV